MQDQEVDLVDAQLARALFKAVQRFVIAEIVDPDLGLDEDLGARQTRAGDRLADAALIAIGGGGIDVAISDPQRFGDRRPCLVGRGLEHAIAERRHFNAIVEGKQGDGHVWSLL